MVARGVGTFGAKKIGMIYTNDDAGKNMLQGAQTKAADLGIELVADRDLLCLDEPDQGLDSERRHDVYTILQNLAHEHGKTVLTIIHDVSEIDMFDQVIFLVKANGVGRLAFSGTPEEGSQHFGVPIAKAYALLEADPEKYVR